MCGCMCAHMARMGRGGKGAVTASERQGLQQQSVLPKALDCSKSHVATCIMPCRFYDVTTAAFDNPARHPHSHPPLPEPHSHHLPCVCMTDPYPVPLTPYPTSCPYTCAPGPGEADAVQCAEPNCCSHPWPCPAWRRVGRAAGVTSGQHLLHYLCAVSGSPGVHKLGDGVLQRAHDGQPRGCGLYFTLFMCTVVFVLCCVVLRCVVLCCVVLQCGVLVV